MSDKRRLVRNTLAYAVVQIAQMISAFVFMPFLIERFTVAGYGTYLLASSVTGYLVLLDFGVGTTVVKYVAQYKAEGDNEKLGDLISNALVFYVAIGVIAAAGLLLFSRFGVGLFRLDSDGYRLAGNLFLAAAGVAFFTWPATIGGLLLNGLQEYTTMSKIGVGVIAGTIVATAAVLITKQGPVVLLVANGIVGVTGGAVYWFFARRRLVGVRISLRRLNMPMLKVIFSFSWVLFVMQVCGLLVYQQTDRVVLGVFVGASAVALYEAASKVQSLVAQLSAMTASAILPAASQFDAERRLDTLQVLFLRGTKYVVAFVTPVALSLAVLARPLLGLWLGPEFAGQALAAQLFLLVWVLAPNVQFASPMLTGMGRLKPLLWITILQTIANLVISIALVKPLGVLGVVIGTVATGLVSIPLSLRYILRAIELPARRWLSEVVRPVYPLLLVPVVVAIVSRYAGLANSLIGVALAGVLSVGAYWLAFYRLGLSAKERGEVRALIAAIGARVGIVRSELP